MHSIVDIIPLSTQIESKIMKVEEDLGQRLGATSRSYAYHHLLTNLDNPDCRESVLKLCANPERVSKVERILFDKMLEKGIAKGIMKGVKANKEQADVSLVALRKVFDDYSKILEASGGEYLMDEKTNKGLKLYGFTAADLAFAALACPLIQPPEFLNWSAPLDKLPRELGDLREELINTTAEKHALKMYKNHRLVGDAHQVEAKSVNRNKFPGSVLFGAAISVGIGAAVYSATS